MVGLRNEEAALSGLLTLRIGGQSFDVPTLKIKQSRKWKSDVSVALGSAVSRISDVADTNADWLRPLANVPTDIMLDLVLAYDVKNVMGGRKWLEENADDREVWEALQQMLGATFPFVAALRSAVAGSGDELRQTFVGYLREALRRVQNPSPQALSMNGHSPSGVLTPTPLKSASPTSST